MHWVHALKEKVCFSHFLAANEIKCMVEIHTHAKKRKVANEVNYNCNCNLTVAAKQIPQNLVNYYNVLAKDERFGLQCNLISIIWGFSHITPSIARSLVTCMLHYILCKLCDIVFNGFSKCGCCRLWNHTISFGCGGQI